ncbi:MAG: hypothetical protein ACFNL5_06790, partial [Rothia dentocariosa]
MSENTASRPDLRNVAIVAHVDHGKTTIVAAPASDSAGFKWLAPFAGAALGQHWMYQGYHVLVIYDD